MKLRAGFVAAMLCFACGAASTQNAASTSQSTVQSATGAIALKNPGFEGIYRPVYPTSNLSNKTR